VYSIADVLPLPMPAQIAQRLCSRAKSTIGFWMGRRTSGFISANHLGICTTELSAQSADPNGGRLGFASR